MNETKSGVYTTEFWLSAFIALGAGVIGVLVAQGALTSDEASAWIALVGAIAPIFAILVMGWVGKTYTESRTAVKLEAMQSQDLLPLESGPVYSINVDVPGEQFVLKAEVADALRTAGVIE